jgi:hypothetical protein
LEPTLDIDEMYREKVKEIQFRRTVSGFVARGISANEI